MLERQLVDYAAKRISISAFVLSYALACRIANSRQ